MTTVVGNNTKEQSQRAQARWGMLRGAMLQGRLKEIEVALQPGEPKLPTEEEKVQSNLAIFTGFVLRAVEKGWFKRRAEDGTLLKPMAFDDVKKNINERVAQEAMDGGLFHGRKFIKSFTAEEAEKYRVEVVKRKLKGWRSDKILVWCHDNAVLGVKKGEAVDTTNFITKGKSGTLAYVADKRERLYVFPHIRSRYERAGAFIAEGSSHLGVLAGAPVINAGLVRIQWGKIKYINDDSGHYKPEPDNMAVFLRKLLKNKSVFFHSAQADVFKILPHEAEVTKQTIYYLDKASTNQQMEGLAHKTPEKGYAAIDAATKEFLQRMERGKGVSDFSGLSRKKRAFTARDYNEMIEVVGTVLDGAKVAAVSEESGRGWKQLTIV